MNERLMLANQQAIMRALRVLLEGHSNPEGWESERKLREQGKSTEAFLKQSEAGGPAAGNEPPASDAPQIATLPPGTMVAAKVDRQPVVHGFVVKVPENRALTYHVRLLGSPLPTYFRASELAAVPHRRFNIGDRVAVALTRPHIRIATGTIKGEMTPDGYFSVALDETSSTSMIAYEQLHLLAMVKEAA